VNTRRVLAVGRTESGKSYYLRNAICRRSPRVLHLDVMGEAHKEASPRAVQVEGLRATLDALVVAADYTRWDIWAFIREPDQLQALATRLVYKPTLAEPSLAELLGGLVLECSEVSTLAPLRGTPPDVSGLWSWGRHRGLSIAAATQHPALCDVRVRAMSEYVVLFTLTDAASLRWVRENMGEELVPVVRRLPQGRGVRVEMGTGRAVEFGRDWQLLREWKLGGTPRLSGNLRDG